MRQMPWTSEQCGVPVMSQIRPLLAVISLATTVALAGCGDKNPQAVFSPESGHPSNWVGVHKTSAKASLESCLECHAEQPEATTGNKGVSKVSCIDCHASPTSKHPVSWNSYAYARHAATYSAEIAVPGKAVSCSNASCHGTQLNGSSDGKIPSCTKCHPQKGATFSKHPTSWTSVIADHGATVKASGTVSCSTTTCHGSKLEGVFLSGPACKNCHSDSPSQFVKHPATWTAAPQPGLKYPDHKNLPLTGTASCSTSACHGTTLAGGAFGGPSCYSCHINYAGNNGEVTRHPVTVSSWRTAHSGYVTGHTPLPSPTCTNAACHLPGTRTADAYCKNCHNGK